MLDLLSEEFRLHPTSGPTEFISIQPLHLPILQQGSHRWQDPQANQRRRDYVSYSRFLGQHIVLDLPVPPRLYESIAPIQTGLQQRYHVTSRNEFSHVRYTPVTCDPSAFAREGYFLLPQLYVKSRPIEVCIAVTIYNEDDLLLGGTLAALHQNIKALQDPTRAHPWGPNSWKKIVVCIICDGRAKINPRTKALLASLGLYQDISLSHSIDGRNEVVTHLFEYSTHTAIRIKGTRVSLEHDTPDAIPCQTILCLKERNQKKINSHRWFLTAICGVLNPTIAIFLDAGTIPQPDSLYHLCEPFYRSETVAVATGFCRAFAYNRRAETLNPLIGFQKFEYQLNNALDRPMESLFGRRFSLNKGGFAAYRYSVTESGGNEAGAFEDYFAGEQLRLGGTLSKMNSFLTEDRAIAASLLRVNRKVWRTVSIDTAEVRVDIPDTFAEFCLQRRRWINGDLYSTLHELRNISDFMRVSSWSFFCLFRILGLLSGAIYQALNILLQFFAVGNLFAIFYIIISSLGTEVYFGLGGRSACLAISYVYIFLFLAGLICAMGNRPTGTKLYRWISFVWVLMYSYFFAMMLYLIINGSHRIIALSHGSRSALLAGSLFLYLVWPLVIIYSIWLLAPLTLGRKPYSVSSCIWHLVVLPIYTNLITTYAFCNIHDVSWGTIGDSVPEKLPNLRRPKEPRAKGSILIEKELDQESGDLILNDYSEYLGELDSYFESQQQECEAERAPRTVVPYSRELQENLQKDFRTLSIFCWLGLNGALVMVVMNIPAISRFTPTAEGGEGLLYVGVVLWAYTGIVVFQYCFTILYALSKLGKYLWSLTSASFKGTQRTEKSEA